VSGSDDCSIKVWSISDVALTLIKEIKEHTSPVRKVIPLSKERFASCSNDGTVKVWKDDNTYECLSTLRHDDSISSILQLRGKEVLVSCGYYSSSKGVSFWNLNDYTELHTIEGYIVDYPTHMIELSDGNIALSAKDKPYPIVIIDSSSYQVKKMIAVQNNETISIIKPCFA
jgi:WD40 repeat protein